MESKIIPESIDKYLKKNSLPNQDRAKAILTPINVPITYPNIPTKIAGVTIRFCPNEAAIGAATEGPIILAADETITSWTLSLNMRADNIRNTKWKTIMII